MRNNAIYLATASGATTVQGTYEIVKGIAGEFMFWLSFVTAILLLTRVILKIARWSEIKLANVTNRRNRR